MMHGHGQSDGRIVPEKSPNKAGEPAAEGREGRRPAKRNAPQTHIPRTQGRMMGMPKALARIRQAVRRDKGGKLTSLYHHVYDMGHLREAYFGLKRRAAPGVDGVTWQQYGQDLEANLQDLSGRLRRARGDVIIVRYADDFVVGFENREEAEAFQGELGARMAKFNLEMQAEKTRLIEFGRQTAANRARRGEGKAATFDFLGFTHIGGKTRKGGFTVRRQTMRKRVRAKLRELKQEMRRRVHQPIPKQGQWLRGVLQGHYRYYGVPMNAKAMGGFRQQVMWLWKRALGRRSQRGRITWERMKRLADKWLPYPHIYHPWSSQRLVVRT